MRKERISINLKSILDLSAKLNNSVDINLILNSTLLSIMGKLGISRSAIYTKNEDKFNILIKKGKCEVNEIDYFEISSLRKIDEKSKVESKLLDCNYKYIIPLFIADKLEYIIVLSESLIYPDINEEEIEYLNLLTNIASIALQNAKNYLHLDIQKVKAERKNILLENLFQNARYFFSYFQKDEILNILSYNLMGQLIVNKFAVILYNENDQLFHAKNKFQKEISKNIIDVFINKKTTSHTSEITDSKIKKELELNDIELVTPLIFKNEVKGLIFVAKSMSKKSFGDDDLLFIEYLGNTAIAALENDRLFKEELKKKQLESELNLALDIQKGLFPSEDLLLGKYEIYGKSIPSKQVGGDYYDHIQMNKDCYFLLVADVSGKGMPAAMIMANLQAALRVLVKLNLPLKDIITNLNYIVFSNTAEDKFVTFFGGILNTKENTFEYINAGHNPPYLFRNNEIIELDKGGLFLGLMEEPFPYESDKIQLQPNDKILLYTDGITEAQNTHEEEFGTDKLQEIAINQSEDKLLLEEIVNAVKLFSYGSNQYDDITLLSLVCK